MIHCLMQIFLFVSELQRPLLPLFDLTEAIFCKSRVPEPDRITGDPLWKGHVKSWTAELASENPPRKPAEMFTVAMIVSLELLVSDEDEPICARALSWVMLCMVWASLRCDGGFSQRQKQQAAIRPIKKSRPLSTGPHL